MDSQDGKKVGQIKDFLKRTSFSVKTVIVLCYVAICALLIIAVVPEQASWEIGTVATRDIAADRSITFEDSEATRKKQMEALKGFEDVYKLNLTRFNNETVDSIERIFKEIDEVLFAQIDEDMKTKVAHLKAITKIRLTSAEAQAIAAYDKLQLEYVHKQAIEIVGENMRHGVREDGVIEARNRILKIVQTSDYSETDKMVLKKVLKTIPYQPTLVYDQQSTEQKKNEIIRTVEPVWQTLQKDQRIVTRGDIISATQYDAMQALGYTTDHPLSFIILGVLAFVAVFFMVVYIYLKRFFEDPMIIERNYKLILLILLIEVVAASVIFSVRIGDTTQIMQQVGFLTPVAAGVMLVAVLIGTREALFVLLVATMFLGLYAQDATFIISGMLGGLAAISQTGRLNRRMDLGWAAVYIALAMAISIVAFGFMRGYTIKAVLMGVLYGVGNGFLSVVLTLGLLPYFEVAFGITTAMSLLELGDPSNKLLKKLMQEAPGTYHHSIMVANLAEAAADAVGANPLLVRTGAYYHDIGKLRRPVFFTENQFHGENPHEKISPSLSTLIITSHVKDGVTMAKEARLPDVIIDLIAQHHGNSIVQFFYAKAKKIDGAVKVNNFRYQHKRPQTREAAILMLADTIEAAVRSTRHRLTTGEVEGFIHLLIKRKLDDGQLQECDLTFKDLNKIADIFTRVLGGQYHKRIEYPAPSELSVGSKGEQPC